MYVHLLTWISRLQIQWCQVHYQLIRSYACVLFDPGAMHSFISSAFIWKHALLVTTMDYALQENYSLSTDNSVGKIIKFSR